MAQDRTIAELMSVPEPEHDLAWLKRALQAAVELEFATIPPYLCARWSIKSGGDVASSIRTIFREEMLHMGLVCNLLCALGETPWLNTPEAVPTYPGALPGGVLPALKVSLQGLTDVAVKLFMKIEFPEFDPVAVGPGGEEFTSIGQFYSAILTAFESLNLPLSADRQLDVWLGLWKITSLDEVRRAIGLIKRQGEGSNISPEDTGAGDLAHYYRFKEIDVGRKLRKNPETGAWEFTGAPVPFPQTWPMAEVPAGGYKQSDVSPDVWTLIDDFDTKYTTMLDQLQAAWETGSSDSLNEAIDTMRELGDPAVELMKVPIPGGTATYGPCFRLRRQ